MERIAPHALVRNFAPPERVGAGTLGPVGAQTNALGQGVPPSLQWRVGDPPYSDLFVYDCGVGTPPISPGLVLPGKFGTLPVVRHPWRALTQTPGYPMNKQSLISVVALFVLSMALGFVVHAVVLKNDYAQLPNLMRSEADQKQYFGAMLLAHVFMAIGVTAIYRRGREAGKSTIGQGVRFGVLLAVVCTIPVYLIYYAVQPMPLPLVEKQIVLDTIAMVILGVAAAGLNRLTA